RAAAAPTASHTGHSGRPRPPRTLLNLITFPLPLPLSQAAEHAPSPARLVRRSRKEQRGDEDLSDGLVGTNPSPRPPHSQAVWRRPSTQRPSNEGRLPKPVSRSLGCANHCGSH